MPERLPAPAVPLYDYQREWIADRSRLKIGMWSRQVGKTFTTTLEIVDDVHQAMSEGRRSPWVILSRGDRQAREAMRAGIRMHARAYGLFMEEAEREIEIDGKQFTVHEWDAGNGNLVTAVPANPDTARGYSRNIFLDEFALHLKSRDIWAAIYPSITRGWKARITSTPKGKSGKFYEIMSARDGIWSRHVIDIHRAIAGGYPADAGELRAGLADDELWRQEYLCEWLDEASAWLTYEMIDNCEDPDAGKPELYGGGPTFIGNDIARSKHLWAAAALELVGDVAWTREISILRDKSFAVQDKTLDEMVLRRYRTAKVAMDKTGMGWKPVEDAERRYGASRVDGVTFTPANKLDLATALRRRFQDRTIRIPAGDVALRADLHSVQRIAGPAGIRLLADDKVDGHADRFWAYALAAGAAGDGKRAYGYIPVRPGDPRDRDRPRRFQERLRGEWDVWIGGEAGGAF